ncbi:hypothetical protein ACSVDM_28585 [Nocardia sp. JW2]|uniref:hypothetical protein n=1 Tax=Nocardia sp. JW2 TaxID=3450738 RepID=UPI003F4373B8
MFFEQGHARAVLTGRISLPVGEEAFDVASIGKGEADVAVCAPGVSVVYAASDRTGAGQIRGGDPVQHLLPAKPACFGQERGNPVDLVRGQCVDRDQCASRVREVEETVAASEHLYLDSVVPRPAQYASHRRRPVSRTREAADELLEDTVADGDNGSRYRVGRGARSFSLDVGNRDRETGDEVVFQAWAIS